MKLKKYTSDYLLILLLVVVAIAVGIFFPLAVIWATNTLFNLNIPYTFWTWLSVVVLHIFFQGNAIINKTNEK